MAQTEQIDAGGPMGRRLVASLAAKAWSALISIATIPIYVHFLGPEGYGLVGLFALVLTLGLLIDFGLSATLTRELARAGDVASASHYPRDLLRSFEVAYWVGAAVFGAVVAAGAVLLVDAIDRSGIPAETATAAVALMGLAVIFQLPLSLYSGALLGRHRQVTLAVTTIVMYTLRGGGAVVVLALWSPTIVAFFVWQVVAAGLHTALVGWLAWRSLPRAALAPRPRASMSLIRPLWRFAGGMAGIGVLSVALTQVDKLVLVQLVSIAEFGYYAIANVAASVLVFVVSPLFSVAFPSLSGLAASDDPAAVGARYRSVSEVTTVLVAPAAAVLAVFSEEIVTLWLREPATVEQVAPLLGILAIGYGIQAVGACPYALQVAHGWTRLALVSNLVALVVQVPLVIALVVAYGPTGAAVAWALLSAAHVGVTVTLMHRRVLAGQLAAWWGAAVLRPALPALAVVGLGWLALPSASDEVEGVYVATCALIALASSAAVTPTTRAWFGRVVAPRLGVGAGRA